MLALQSEWRTAALTDRALRLQLLEEMQRRTFHKPLNPFRVNMGPTDTIPVDEPAMDGPYEADHHASYADQRTDHVLPFLTEDATILRACLRQNTRGSACQGQVHVIGGSDGISNCIFQLRLGSLFMLPFATGIDDNDELAVTAVPMPLCGLPALPSRSVKSSGVGLWAKPSLVLGCDFD